MKRCAIVFVAAAMLAACGSAAANDREVASLSTTNADDATTGTGDPPATTGAVDPSEAPLQFAKCMRQHGIDMPDPTISDGGGGVMVQIGGAPGSGNEKGPDPKELEAANKECEHFLKDASAGFDPPSPEDQKKMQDQALAFSKCMRDHGVDMPDPQVSTDGGGFSIAVGVTDGTGPTTNGPPIDFNSKEFKAASDACGSPGGGFAVSTKPADG
jgi:hypothetical protein